MSIAPPRVEQVALDILLDNAYEEFQQALHSAGARLVLWGSFSSAESLVENYLRAKDKYELLDKRKADKNRKPEDQTLLGTVRSAAEEAADYVGWARKHDAQPILREMLISYCSSFESFLKNIALVSLLAGEKQSNLDTQVFVPGDQFKRALNQVKAAWKNSGDRQRFRARVFFDDYVVARNPDSLRFIFSENSEFWSVCETAFNPKRV